MMQVTSIFARLLTIFRHRKGANVLFSTNNYCVDGNDEANESLLCEYCV